MIRMFRHIGRKVRGLAAALCVIGILGSLGAGAALYLLKILQQALRQPGRQHLTLMEL